MKAVAAKFQAPSGWLIPHTVCALDHESTVVANLTVSAPATSIGGKAGVCPTQGRGPGDADAVDRGAMAVVDWPCPV